MLFVFDTNGFEKLRFPYSNYHLVLGHFTSQDSVVFVLRSLGGFVVSANLISAILVGHFTRDNISLRRLSAKLRQETRRQMSKSWLGKFPFSCKLEASSCHTADQTDKLFQFGQTAQWLRVFELMA